jgi:CRP/FNR family transcriptional regulator, anaerobic regulatory protein
MPDVPPVIRIVLFFISIALCPFLITLNLLGCAGWNVVNLGLLMDIFSLDDFIKYIRAQSSLLNGQKAAQFHPGEDIFSQGDVNPDIFVLTDGLVKLHYITHDGKEWIKSFIMDKGLLGSRASQSLGLPSPYAATCLETSQVYSLPYKTFETMCSEDPALSAMAFQFFQWLGLKKELREHDLLCLSAEERYRKFLIDKPDLAQRITQVDMARYLGITPIALSRIKGRVSKK